jgi:hypothetical protein
LITSEEYTNRLNKLVDAKIAIEVLPEVVKTPWVVDEVNALLISIHFELEELERLAGLSHKNWK